MKIFFSLQTTIFGYTKIFVVFSLLVLRFLKEKAKRKKKSNLMKTTDKNKFL